MRMCRNWRTYWASFWSHWRKRVAFTGCVRSGTSGGRSVRHDGRLGRGTRTHAGTISLGLDGEDVLQMALSGAFWPALYPRGGRELELGLVAGEPDVADDGMEVGQGESGDAGGQGMEEEAVEIDWGCRSARAQTSRGRLTAGGLLLGAAGGEGAELCGAEGGPGELVGLARVGVEDLLLLHRGGKVPTRNARPQRPADPRQSVLPVAPCSPADPPQSSTTSRSSSTPSSTRRPSRPA